MKSLAILDPQSALALTEVLQEDLIRCTTRTITEESGLEGTEVLVEDSQYELACQISEGWEEARQEEAYAKLRKTCPKCGSPHSLERAQDPHYNELEIIVLRCQNCGEVVPL